MINSNKWLNLAIKTKAVKMITATYGRYRLIHPLTWVYLPYLLLAVYKLAKLIPTYSVLDVFCLV